MKKSRKGIGYKAYSNGIPRRTKIWKKRMSEKR
jgi:hypothetical protein